MKIIALLSLLFAIHIAPSSLIAAMGDTWVGSGGAIEFGFDLTNRSYHISGYHSVFYSVYVNGEWMATVEVEFIIDWNGWATGNLWIDTNTDYDIYAIGDFVISDMYAGWGSLSIWGMPYGSVSVVYQTPWTSHIEGGAPGFMEFLEGEGDGWGRSIEFDTTVSTW